MYNNQDCSLLLYDRYRTSDFSYDKENRIASRLVKTCSEENHIVRTSWKLTWILNSLQSPWNWAKSLVEIIIFRNMLQQLWDYFFIYKSYKNLIFNSEKFLIFEKSSENANNQAYVYFTFIRIKTKK